MKKPRITLLVLIMIIALLILGAAPASAKAERYVFESTQAFIFPQPPPPFPVPEFRTWDSGPIRHVRNSYLAFSVTGDVNGTNHLVINSNTNIATGDGVMWSSIVLDLEWNGLHGTFEGKSQNQVTGGAVLNQTRTHFVGKGTGDFEGMTMFAEYGYDPDVGSAVLRGTILVHKNN